MFVFLRAIEVVREQLCGFETLTPSSISAGHFCVFLTMLVKMTPILWACALEHVRSSRECVC